MAKLRKRVINSKNKKQKAQQQTNNQQLKTKMQQLVAEENYVDAMDVMAEIAQTGIMDSETMYLGALCYFKTDDCERATKWVAHALEKDAGNYRAKLLLVRICIMEDRVQDGLHILENLLATDGGKISEAEREDLLDDLYYFKYSDQEMLADCPQIKKLLGIEDSNAVAEEARQTEIVASVEKTAMEAHVAIEESAEHEKVAEVESQPTEEAAMPDAHEIVENILSQAISLQDKVKLLNNFAAGCYQSGDYAGAYTLLAEALKIDSCNEAVLRNMVYTCMAQQDMDKALAFASNMPMVDFACIHAIQH